MVNGEMVNYPWERIIDISNIIITSWLVHRRRAYHGSWH
jgi:hypothetical protein